MKYQLKINKADIKNLSVKINALTLRERVLLAASALLGIYILWNVLIFSSLSFMSNRIDDSIKKEKKEIESINRKAEALKKQSKENAIPILQNKLKTLESAASALKNEVSTVTGEWLSPPEMTALLQKILEGQNDVALMKLGSITNKPLFEEVLGKLNAKMKIYKRGLEIELEGNYFGIMSFVDVISQCHNGVLWDGLWYEVKKYPTARVKLVVYTLSTEEGWIGV